MVGEKAKKFTVYPKLLNKYHKMTNFPKKIFVYFDIGKDFYMLKLRRKSGVTGNNNKTLNMVDCLYHGVVNLDITSHCELSLCYGLHGTIDYGKKHFYIKPKFVWNNSTPGLHNIEKKHFVNDFSVDSKHQKAGVNVMNDTIEIIPKFNSRSRRQLHSHARKARTFPADEKQDAQGDVTRAIKFLELYIVNDFGVYNYFKKNTTFINDRTKLIASMVDEKLRHMNLRVVLVGVEIWTNKNLIDLSTDSRTTLLSFLKYRETTINNKVQNDNAQFISKSPFDNGG